MQNSKKHMHVLHWSTPSYTSRMSKNQLPPHLEATADRFALYEHKVLRKSIGIWF